MRACVEKARVTRSIMSARSGCRNHPDLTNLSSPFLFTHFLPRDGSGFHGKLNHRCSRSSQMLVPSLISWIRRILAPNMQGGVRNRLYLSEFVLEYRLENRANARRLVETSDLSPSPTWLWESGHECGIGDQGSTHAVSNPQARWWRRRCSAHDEKLQRSGQ